MAFPLPFSRLFSARTKVRQSRPSATKRAYQPRLDFLEDRLVPSTLFVDDDHAQNANAQYTSIGAAVAAAQPGDTIRVFAGNYNESVNVDKTLTFVADRRGGSVVVDPAALGAGFNVQANDVRITGFTIQDAQGNAGINLGRTFSGAVIQNDVFQDNTFGIYLKSDGAHATVIEHNQFLHNNADGAAAGNGIYSDQGASNVRIVGNYFTGQQNASVIFVGNGSTDQSQSNIRVEGNAMIDDAPMIFVNLTQSRISHNVSIRSVGTGIFFGGGVTQTQVVGNVLRDGAFTGINLRTDSVNYPVTAPNTNNVIRDNYISGFGDSGIRLRDGAANNLVAGNWVLNNGTGGDPTTGDGISLENAQNNIVRDNQARNNRRDGIRVDAGSAGNRIVHNTMLDNGEHDAHDDSTGTGTAHTANFWIDNTGRTQNHPGLLAHIFRGRSGNGHGHDHDHDHDHDDDDDRSEHHHGHDD
jgi:parallel beta-helix repeat protein